MKILIETFFVLLLTIASCSSITLKCLFEKDFVWQKYGCEVKEFKNENHNSRITSIQGEHAVSLSNDDVHSLRIENVPTIEYFTNDFFVKFPNIRNLVIQRSSLKFLLRGDFVFADNLVNIFITHTDLTNLEDSVFHGTRITKMMILRGNKIRQIAENAFKGMTTLKYLTLSFNEIQTLHVNVFKDLGFLEQLSLNDNQIQFLDQQLLSKNRNLQIIFLNNNQLKSLNGNMFARNEQLREVYLDNNHIKTISNRENFLVNLKSLEIVSLDNNTCVDTMILIMDNLFPPFETVLANC